MKILPINTIKFSADKNVKNNYHQSDINKELFSYQSEISNHYNYAELPNYYKNAIPFKGVTGKGLVKQRGMLLHITSLPATRSFCGQFGDIQTTKFINWLAAAKQTHWIMNPLNALTDPLCPYSSDGRFSRNKFIVNLNKLVEKEYGEILKESELPEDISTPNFTLEMLEKQKNPRFQLAYKRFQNLPNNSPIKQEYNRFLKTNDELWLDEYANFDAIAKRNGKDWLAWDKSLQTAPETAREKGVSLETIVYPLLKSQDKSLKQNEYEDTIGLYKFEQFLYDKQFHELIEELDEKGIKLILDLPIGVSAEGVDTWGKKHIFLLDDNFKPVKVSGCPSEGAFGYTQVWKHALYNYDSPDFWQYQEDTLRQLLEVADLRLDHFVGYVNRAAIPMEYTKPDGTILRGDEIFMPIEQGGMGAGFFDKSWIENIDKKRSPKGENAFELFMRIARECGKKPEDTYILESFGPLAKTKAYKAFEAKYGKDFISQRVPIAMGICDNNKKVRKLNSLNESDTMLNLACLTGNHDMPSLRQYIDKLLGKGLNSEKVGKATKERFKEFCIKELQLTPEEMKDPKTIFDNAMKWHYTKNVKQVQTTIQDALGIYWRPNIPGSWNGMHDKYLQKPTPEALLSYWSFVFPKDFLERENVSGINPGYKSLADKFVNLMNELFPDK